MFSIHFFIKNSEGEIVEITICFVVMSRKTTPDYASVLTLSPPLNQAKIGGLGGFTIFEKG
jgi:hypothetical protein